MRTLKMKYSGYLLGVQTDNGEENIALFDLDGPKIIVK